MMHKRLGTTELGSHQYQLGTLKASQNVVKNLTVHENESNDLKIMYYTMIDRQNITIIICIKLLFKLTHFLIKSLYSMLNHSSL